jgi:hypothetical protein
MTFQTSCISIFTEVEKLCKTCRLLHFNMFHQKGANRSAGLCVAIEKHLKAMRIDVDISNTAAIEITNLSELVRILSIYCSTS